MADVSGDIEGAHRQLAEAIEVGPAPHDARVLAHHWLAAGDARRFARWALPAAQAAGAAGDHRETVRLLEALLTHWDEPGVTAGAEADRSDVVVALARALRRRGDARAAVERCRAALDTDLSTLGRVAILVELAAALTEVADREARSAARDAVTGAESLPDDPESTRLLALAAGTLANFDDVDAAEAAMTAAARRARKWGLDDVVARCDTTLGTLVAVRDPESARAAFDRARESAERLEREEPALLLRYYTNAGDALRRGGRADAAAALAGAGLTWAVDRGFLDTSGAHLAATLVEALLDAGRVEEARRTVATWLPRAGAGRERWWLEALGARAALLAGDWTAARRGLAELDRGAREDGLPASTAEAAAVLRCEVAAVELGDEVVAGLAVRTAQRLRGVAPVAALDLLVLAASRRGASRSIGRGDAAEEVWADVRLRVHPVVEEPWRLLADAWRCPPGSPEGVAAWDAALDATRTRIPVARRVDALLAAAGDAVAAGRAARAGRLLAAAADLVDRCGLGLYSSRVDELRASLVPAPSAAWERLSPREMHVLRGLASGASNEQLGRDLTISVRTVEVHVAHLLRKLGATSRGGAVAAAVRRGLVDEDDLRAAGS